MKLEWKTCFKVGISVFIVFLCIHYWERVTAFVGTIIGAAFPLILGFCMAYIVNLLMSGYEKHYFPKSNKKFVANSRRPVCMILALLTLLAVIALVVSLILPQLVSCVKLIIALAPDAIRQFIDKLDSMNVISEDLVKFLDSVDWKSGINQFFDVFTSGFGNVMDVVVGTVSSVVGGFITAFLGIIFSIYLLFGKEKLCSQVSRVARRYMKVGLYDKVLYVLNILNDCFRRYIVGQCTEAVILGLLCIVGMLILRLPYASMIGALVAFTALIPVAGAYIGAIVGGLMILMVSPVKALVFIIFIIVLQQVEGNVIYPRVVGSSMGLPGIWVLAAVTVGGGIMGVTGMLFSVPIAAALYRILGDNMKKERKMPNEEKKENISL